MYLIGNNKSRGNGPEMHAVKNLHVEISSIKSKRQLDPVLVCCGHFYFKIQYYVLEV